MSKANDEANARIEHKVDFILMYIIRLMGEGYVPPMGDGSHACPVCKQGIKYVVDMMENSVSRLCGCKTGKIPPVDLNQFAPPPAAGGRNGGNEGNASSDDGEAGERRGRRGRKDRPPGR